MINVIDKIYTTHMQFITPTEIVPLQPPIAHTERLVVTGSCFAEHIGQRLAQMKWRTVTNPFGILYNPQSIAQCLTLLIRQHTFTEEQLTLFPHGGWSTWLHHSRYAHPDRTEALHTINHSATEASRALFTSDRLIITLGTAWVYRLKETGQTVGNCHKVPERAFVRQRLTVEEIVNEYASLLTLLKEANPKINVLLTVSPVRHLKDGVHGNQLSKATLLLAVDELCRRYPEQVHYFPAYEMVVDELRDYRFYADDMAHPSGKAVEYVWERFVTHCTDTEAQTFIAQWTKVAKALEHRPFRPDSEKYRDFVRQNLLNIETLKKKYPYLEVENETDTCRTLLKTLPD